MQKYIFYATIFLLPLFFLTYTSNFFSTPKQVLLIFALLLSLIYLAYSIFTDKSLSSSTSPLRFGLYTFVGVILLNIVAFPSNRLEAIVGPGSVYLAMSVWAYLLSMSPSHKFKELSLYAFLGSTSVISLFTLAQLTFLYKLTSLPVFMQSRAFTLTGSPLSSFLLILIGVCVSLYLTLHHHKSSALFAFLTTLHTIALIALGALFFPGQELALNLLPLRASWNIALDAMKEAKSFLLGIGLTNFPTFYNAVKPLFLNTTQFWNLVPVTASSEFLHILTTTGILGILSFISLPLLALKKMDTSDLLTKTVKLILFLSVLMLAFLPSSTVGLFVFFTSMGILAASEPHVIRLEPAVGIILPIVILLAVSTLSFFTFKVVKAESHIRSAQLAVADNDGKRLYDETQLATQLFPSMTSYRLSYSQVNLSLATALSQKESLSDAERENVTTLISQSIREGKAAVTLSPNSATVWQNLGFIYQKLINVAEGSDQYAVEAYAQAVALDPANPMLRVEFGGLLYQLGINSKDEALKNGFYARAQSEFQTAIQLKPDFPNAYYNLAKLLETVKDYGNASLVMQKAISLLGPDNPDLSKANAELEVIKANVPKASPSATPSQSPVPSATPTNPETTISEPEPLPSPLDGGPLDLDIAP